MPVRCTPITELFARNHRFFRTAGDQVVSLPYYGKGVTDWKESTKRILLRPIADGPRGVGWISTFPVRRLC